MTFWFWSIGRPHPGSCSYKRLMENFEEASRHWIIVRRAPGL